MSHKVEVWLNRQEDGDGHLAIFTRRPSEDAYRVGDELELVLSTTVEAGSPDEALELVFAMTNRGSGIFIGDEQYPQRSLSVGDLVVLDGQRFSVERVGFKARPLTALLIPVEGPVEEIELVPEDGSTLKQLQELVGGMIEAVPLPGFIPNARAATSYVNEEGKFGQEVNWRATDFMVPGVGLFYGDWIAGPFVLCGFDPERGEHDVLPASVIKRARLIEGEARTREETR
jgi:hypothetical protein